MAAFTLVHVFLSLLAIGSGCVVMTRLLSSKRLDGWTKVFLATALLTTMTGFFFPFHGFTPGIGVGIVSVGLLAIAGYARYSRALAGPWRKAYVITATTALYLNVFVLIVQLFEKVPSLKAIAPTQSELPFAVTQIGVLCVFIGFGVQAVRKFRQVPRPAVRPTAAG